jgi:hypothetical protein
MELIEKLNWRYATKAMYPSVQVHLLYLPKMVRE